MLQESTEARFGTCGYDPNTWESEANTWESEASLNWREVLCFKKKKQKQNPERKYSQEGFRTVC